MSIYSVIMATELIDYRRALRSAEDNLALALRRCFPVGSQIQWSRGRSRRCKGEVIEHLYGDALIVKNYRTGKLVKIGSFEIVEGLMT